MTTAGPWAGLAALLALSGCASAPEAPAAAAGAPVKVMPQRDWSDAVLYFVILDRYADGSGANNTHVDRMNPGGFHGGDLAGLTAQLDEIADLGATAIWITPVARQIDYCPPAQPPTGVTVPGGWFEHCAFHGYWADDYQSIDPRFGTEAELKALVEAAHARGIKVLLDVVYNHVGYDSRYLKDPAKAGWFRTRPVDCAEDALTCQVGGLPDFRTELPAVQDYLLDAQLGLAQRTGLDGFRLDTVKHVEHAFWQRHRRETRERLGPTFSCWRRSGAVRPPCSTSTSSTTRWTRASTSRSRAAARPTCRARAAPSPSPPTSRSGTASATATTWRTTSPPTTSPCRCTHWAATGTLSGCAWRCR
jgi:alpha-amylase